MGDEIEAAKSECLAIAKQLESKFTQFQFQFGAVFYRDPIGGGAGHETLPLTDESAEFAGRVKQVQLGSGGDGPEDWVGGYRLALTSMKWRTGQKLIIHLADAPAHTREYCGTTNEEKTAGNLRQQIEVCASQGIKIIGMPIRGDYSLLSFKKCQEQYIAAKGPLYEIRPFTPGSKEVDKICANFRSTITAAISRVCRPSLFS
jgi:hypothetical protein